MFGKWFGDEIKGLMLGVVPGFLFLWILYLLLKKSPRRWWLYTGLLAIPFLILAILVQPIWIDPLFNKFGPMKNKEIEGKILQLAERAGIEGAQRLCHRLRRHQAYSFVGHDHRETRRRRTALRDGARDGALRAGACLEVDTILFAVDHRHALRDSPDRRLADRQIPSPLRIHRVVRRSVIAADHTALQRLFPDHRARRTGLLAPQ